ncbi:MAG: hypothetical protein Q8N81_04080 [bacterium]|nr:hypothetical protein [bacterium]
MHKLIRKLLGKLNIVLALTLAVVMTGGLGGVTYVLASSTSNFTQTIGAGSLGIDIVTSGYVTVGSPTVAMGSATFSFACQTITSTLGVAEQQIYATNPDASDGGWIVNLAASNPTDVWDSAGTDFDFNEAGTGGCVDDGATTDADSLGGQMTVDPSYAGSSLNVGQCASCVVTNVSLGTEESFIQTTNNDIDIVTGAIGSDDIGDWRVQGVRISQKIPKEQPAASDYDINMTLTIATL